MNGVHRPVRMPVRVDRAVLVRLLLLLALGLCSQRSHSSGSEAIEPTGAVLCRATSSVERLAHLEQLESEDGGPALVDRPWHEECVTRRLDELDAAIATYCDEVAKLSPDDPILRSRVRSLRHRLVRAYHDLATRCRRSRWSSQAESRPLPGIDDEGLREQISREWCYDTGELFRLLKRSASRTGLTPEQSRCLDRNAAVFRDEMDSVCEGGWKNAVDGVVVVSDWYASCGLEYFPSK